MPFYHNPEDTCGFSTMEEYNAAFRKLYGSKFEDVTPELWDNLVQNRVCPIQVTPRIPLEASVRDTADRIAIDRGLPVERRAEEEETPTIRSITPKGSETATTTPTREPTTPGSEYTPSTVPSSSQNLPAVSNWVVSRPNVNNNQTTSPAILTDLEKYGSIASIIGAAGVVAILIYLWRTR